MKTCAAASGATDEDHMLRATASRSTHDVTTVNCTLMTTPTPKDIILLKTTLSISYPQYQNPYQTMENRPTTEKDKPVHLGCLSETHHRITGEEKYGDATLILSGRNDGKYRQGIGFLLSRKARKSGITATLISERLIM